MYKFWVFRFAAPFPDGPPPLCPDGLSISDRALAGISFLHSNRTLSVSLKPSPHRVGGLGHTERPQAGVAGLVLPKVSLASSTIPETCEQASHRSFQPPALELTQQMLNGTETSYPCRTLTKVQVCE